jgi:hypothetical protein
MLQLRGWKKLQPGGLMIHANSIKPYASGLARSAVAGKDPWKNEQAGPAREMLEDISDGFQMSLPGELPCEKQPVQSGTKASQSRINSESSGEKTLMLPVEQQERRTDQGPLKANANGTFTIIEEPPLRFPVSPQGG